MKTEKNGKPITICDFCEVDADNATIVDADRVAICEKCVSKCFLILMAQLNKPALRVEEILPDENKNATSEPDPFA